MEHIAHLEILPASRFQFAGMPLRVRGATVSPIRAVAIRDVCDDQTRGVRA